MGEYVAVGEGDASLEGFGLEGGYEEGGAANVEEVVGGSHMGCACHLGEEVAPEAFGVVGRCGVLGRCRFGCGQCGIVGLACRGEGHRWELDEVVGHHVGGERQAQLLGEPSGGDGAVGGEVGTEMLPFVGNEDCCLPDAFCLSEVLLYFFGFYAVAMQFQLPVFAADVFQLTVIVPSGKVACVVWVVLAVGGFLRAGKA